jgi:hypothetical protein
LNNINKTIVEKFLAPDSSKPIPLKLLDILDRSQKEIHCKNEKNTMYKEKDTKESIISPYNVKVDVEDTKVNAKVLTGNFPVIHVSIS